jgi:SAM-dependent methyltransferase
MHHGTLSALAEFDHWSRTYDRSILQRWFFRPSHELLLRQLEPGDRRILDIGCGTGLFAARVREHLPEAQVCGLDLSGNMLAHAAARWEGCDGLRPVRGDSGRLPFRDGLFDVVTCSHSFHHYPDQAAVVAEVSRVLRPGGRLMIIDGDRDRLWGWFIFDVIVTLAEGAVHHCSAARFRDLFRAAGFRHVRQHRRGGPLPFLLTVGAAHAQAQALEAAA